MDETGLARIGENQSRFRRANEQIELAADDRRMYMRIPFLCECSRVDCLRVVELTMTEYENVRVKPERFFTAPDHQGDGEENAEVVVEQFDNYVIVDKIGIAGDIAKLRFAELQVHVAPEISRDPKLNR